MNRISLYSYYAVMLVLVLTTANTLLVTATFQWDHDSLDDCRERYEAGQCTQDDTTFYQCPLACTVHTQDAGSRTQGETEDPDGMFELSTPLPGGKTLAWDRFEGYVTVAVVIPLLPGMAQYYFDMMEHLHSVYPYTLEIVVFPVRREDHPKVQLKIPDTSKIVVVAELEREGDKIESKSNPVLEYLEEVIYPGNAGFVFTDRVTTYMISMNAKFIEKDASPTLDYLERLTAHHVTAYEWKGEM